MVDLTYVVLQKKKLKQSWLPEFWKKEIKTHKSKHKRLKSTLFFFNGAIQNNLQIIGDVPFSSNKRTHWQFTRKRWFSFWLSPKWCTMIWQKPKAESFNFFLCFFAEITICPFVACLSLCSLVKAYHWKCVSSLCCPLWLLFFCCCWIYLFVYMFYPLSYYIIKVLLLFSPSVWTWWVHVAK